MKALLLAGGLGTRLRPLTFTRPKVLLPIANRPHIEHVLDLCRRHDITDVVLLTSYLAEAFAPLVKGAADRGLTVEVTHETEPLGTAGALKNAEPRLDDSTFVAFNGDILSDVDLGALIDFHRDRHAEATIYLTPVDDPSAYGVVPTDDDGRVLDFVEKPPSNEAPTNLINAGIYVLEPSVLERIPAGEPWSAERALFPDLVASGAPVYARAQDAYWMDIGTPEKYLQANLDALHGVYPTDAVAAPSADGLLVAEGAVVAAGARVSSACIGAGADVRDAAEVRRCVLLPAVRISEGAQVIDSILGEGVVVEQGAEVIGRVIPDGATVGTSTGRA
jgi:mannose-1-phosphate guanylyltransferase